MFKSKELKEKLAKIDADQRSIVETAKAAGRESLDADEEKRFDAFQEDFGKLKRELDRTLALEERDAYDADPIDQPDLDTDKRTNAEKYSDAFEKYVRYGVKEEDLEQRAQSTTNAAGGYLIPQGFSGEIEKSMKDYSGILQVARVITTNSTGQIDWPTVDDTSNKGRLLAEAADASSGATDVVFGSKTLDAYKYTSDLIKVNAELLEDEAIGMSELLNDLLAERLGRIANDHLSIGTGSSQPNGVATAAAAGVTAGASAITRANLVDLIHSVDSAYRRNGARFMFNDATLGYIKKLSFGSADDRPLYIGGDARNGSPSTIEGYPYTINFDLANIATTNRSVLFGDFSKYVVRQVRGISLKRADERYIETDQVGFVGFARWDGELINTAAVKRITHS